MRIAIDARLNAYRQGGIPQYTRQLMTALAEVAEGDTIISLQHREHLRPLVVAENVVRRTVHTPPHHRFEQWTLPAEALLARPDVLHMPDFIAPLRRPFPAVVTIHDLAFLHYPQILDDAARAFYSRVKASALRASAVIAVSEATRQDIAQLLDIPIEQIDVIHEAAAPVYGRVELRPGEVRVLDGVPIAAGSFMLFVSTLEPRKNLPTLLRALRIALDRSPDAGYRLVVAGSRGWRDEEIFTTVRDLRLEDHVVFAQRVGQYDLRWLYNACRLYINPSLYEGFGLPLLEAMACGAPCLAAATSSLPEIGGEAAVYVPPLDAGLWADAIGDLWDDEDRRADLSRRGRVQSQRFSWVRAARQTLEVYKRAAAGGSLARTADPLPGAAEPAPLSPETHCPRCGSAWVDGRLAGEAAVLRGDSTLPPLQLDPHARLCPSCGRVQLQIAPTRAIARPAPHDAPHEPAPAVALIDPAPHDAPHEPAPAVALIDPAPHDEAIEIAPAVALIDPAPHDEAIEIAPVVALHERALAEPAPHSQPADEPAPAAQPHLNGASDHAPPPEAPVAAGDGSAPRQTKRRAKREPGDAPPKERAPRRKRGA